MDLTSAQMTQLKQMLSSPVISANAVSNFLAQSNSVTQGVDVTFTLTDDTGISAVTLLRNYVMDAATATVLQTWNPLEQSYTWSDTDNALQSQGQAFYWLVLSAMGASGTDITVGPQQIVLNPQLVPPVAPDEISASHAGVVNGTVLVTANVDGIVSGVKIYVTGYKGNAAAVAVAESASTPVQFVLDQTGETITLEAIGVSAGGAEAPTGPTTTLTLDSGATIPAKPEGVEVTQIAAGNQVMFPSSRDAGPTYKIYRAQRGQTFLLATLLATVTGTAGELEYLDTAGLSGDWEYFIIATNAVGDSAPSNPASPAILFTSATIPPNVPVNTTNTATIDSIDTGTNVLVRIYGPGGVGTSYNRLTGFGQLARPNGTISGLAYATKYAIIWTGSVFLAETTYPSILPDGYEFVGSILTTGPTGVVGLGATVALVIDAFGHIIQANPVTLGSDYVAAMVDISGGGGSDGQVQANVDPSGTIPSYTVINGGTGYATTPTGTVVGSATGGTTGGGGTNGTSDGSLLGCVEEGTLVEVPEGTTEELLECDEWVVLNVGSGPLRMHPDTLISVFKRASELTSADRIEVQGGFWRKGIFWDEKRPSVKVRRTCPGGVYFAGPDMVRLHNNKVSIDG